MKRFTLPLLALVATLLILGTISYTQTTVNKNGSASPTLTIANPLPVSLADNMIATLGAKTDAKSSATDGTSVSLMKVLKQISYMLQNPAPTPITYTAGGAIAASDTATVFLSPSTSTGWTPFNASAADGATACTSTKQEVKSTGGALGGYILTNPNTTDEWINVYNAAAASVTVGTTNPAVSFRIPGRSDGSVAANVEITQGILLGTGITISCTSSAGGSGSPSTALEGTFLYK